MKFCQNAGFFYLPKFQDKVWLKFWKSRIFPNFWTISVYTCIDVNFIYLWYTQGKMSCYKIGPAKTLKMATSGTASAKNFINITLFRFEPVVLWYEILNTADWSSTQTWHMYYLHDKDRNGGTYGTLGAYERHPISQPHALRLNKRQWHHNKMAKIVQQHFQTSNGSWCIGIKG